MKSHKSIFNWSGGKDSAIALYYTLQKKEFQVGCLLTSMNSANNRITMHGVREKLLEQQAGQMGITLHKLFLPDQPSMEEYDNLMKFTMQGLKEEGYTHSIFGDIFLEDLKKYREQKLKEVDLQAYFPLWKRDTKEVIHEFLELGFKAKVVCANAALLDESFVGRDLDMDFIADLPMGVDPCGENGEFHTFVYAGPIFTNPIQFQLGKNVYKEYDAPNAEKNQKHMGFWFCDLIPSES